MTPRNPQVGAMMAPIYDVEHLRAIRRLLVEREAITFRELPSGLFSAAANGRAPHTGYQAVWVRDNVHIANALLETGETERAICTVNALADHFERQAPRFDAIIADPSIASSPRNRPHVKFNGDPPSEIPDWTHDQNDALGYFVWIFCRAAQLGLLRQSSRQADLMERFVRYFDAIQYWQDRDSGHWEEARKNGASSVGTVLAGLRKLRELSIAPAECVPALDRLIEEGAAHFDRILPHEAIDPPERARRYDAALLFLIYPLGVVDWPMAQRILDDVQQNLQGEIGVRRYLGDSFWCTDYRRKVQPEDRTRDYSDDIETRDRLCAPGEEAQWCIFDPILSAIWGRRFALTRDRECLERQTGYFNRALSQITPAFECPELWHWESAPDGSRSLETSEATPLLWTQANFLLALAQMEASAAS